MKVAKWMASPRRGKSLLPSTIITLAIIAMLVLSGPAQAVAVVISGQSSYTKDKDIEFQVRIELNENDKFVPLTNISLNLTGNVSKNAVFDLDGKKISGNCNIEMEPVSVPDSNDLGYGYGYGYDNRTGSGYNFGYGYGYGYGYGGGGGNINFIYNVTIGTSCLTEGRYTVVATLNTDQKISFQSSPFKFVLGPGKTLNADVEIKPETLNRASKGTITAFITSEAFDIKKIEGTTVRITCDGCNSAHAVKWNTAGEKFIAKFNIRDLNNIHTGDSVRFNVTGELKNGTVFEGSDTIRVIDQGKDRDDEDDECECEEDDEEHDEEDDEHEERDDECDEHEDHDDENDRHIKEHDDDHKQEKNHKNKKDKDDDKKNENNGGKGKKVTVNNNNINIEGNTGTVIIKINNQGSDAEVNHGNSNSNNKKKENGNKEVKNGNNNREGKHKK